MSTLHSYYNFTFHRQHYVHSTVTRNVLCIVRLNRGFKGFCFYGFCLGVIWVFSACGNIGSDSPLLTSVMISFHHCGSRTVKNQDEWPQAPQSNEAANHPEAKEVQRQEQFPHCITMIMQWPKRHKKYATKTFKEKGKKNSMNEIRSINMCTGS